MKRRVFLASVAAISAAAVLGWHGTAHADAAQAAVEAAKQFSGTEITLVWEAGLQALDPLNFSGPLWEKETGIKVNVIEVPVGEMFTKILQEHRAGSGAYDALSVTGSWMSDLVRAGALAPLDDWMATYGFAEEFQGIAPVYRDNQAKVDGVVYGLPDDGDVFILYYRTDVLGDPAIQAAYKEKFGSDLPVPPTTWAELDQVGQFITEHTGGKPYGASFFRDPTVAYEMFQGRFRIEGGRFFDPETMRATINSPAGVKVFTDWRAENMWMPPGVEAWGFVENLAAFLQGDTAMTLSWPPYGRWAANYGSDQEALSWVPKSTIAGNVGYALTPGGRPQLAGGYSLGVSASSKNQEAAYLFIQWLNSEPISLQRVMLPAALRDPFRTSHFASAEYKALWPEAPQYLATLEEAANVGLLDLSIIQTSAYIEVLYQAISRLWAGEDPQAILDDAAAQWDALTDRIGVDAQRAAYASWMSNKAAYP